MDFVGQYFEEMILSISASEISQPSSDQSEYVQKYSTYLQNHNLDFDFEELTFDDSALFEQLTNEVVNCLEINDIDTALAMFLAFEDVVSGSMLLSSDQKKLLLALSSMIKYTKSTIYQSGVTVAGNTLHGIFWDCFNSNFIAGAKAGLQTLSDFGNPVLCGLAWAGLPVTVGGSLGNGLFNGIANCI